MNTFAKVLVTLVPLAGLLASPANEKKPSANDLKGDTARGRMLFESTCAECHNAYSKDEDIGPGLKGIRDGKLPDGNPATRDKLIDIINRGPAEMPSFKERFSEQQKADVVDFVLTL